MCRNRETETNGQTTLETELPPTVAETIALVQYGILTCVQKLTTNQLTYSVQSKTSKVILKKLKQKMCCFAKMLSGLETMEAVPK